jgi:molybdenum cofactor cytidylyltransferase
VIERAARCGVDVAVAILAAGSSSRLGRPKQLLPIRGIRRETEQMISRSRSPRDGIAVPSELASGPQRIEDLALRVGREKDTLLGHAIEVALSLGDAPVAVVLGAHRKEIEAALFPRFRERVAWIENAAFAEGMASSIRAATEWARTLTVPADGLLLMLCDQPRISSSHLRRLVTTFASDGDGEQRRPVGSLYGGSVGVPAVFPRASFPELLSLTGDRGAKALLQPKSGGGGQAAAIDWPDGDDDIDTIDDARSSEIVSLE